MNRCKFSFCGFFGLAALVWTLVFTACPSGSLEKEDPDNPSTGSAAAPTITAQPQGAIYFVGDTDIKNLSVSVKSMTADDVLSFQWYSNTSAVKTGGTAINGATGLTYALPSTITAAAKTHYYYVIITNTNKTKKNPAQMTTSAVATVDVQAEVPNVANAVVTVNTDQRYQYVRGFGGMDVAWDNPPPPPTLEEVDTMFNPEKLGYNMFRVMILPQNTDIDKTMEELVTNIIYPKYDRSDFYERVKIVNKYGGYVLASPWSPPAEWKTNNSVLGGGSGLKKENYIDFANYLRRYCEIMYENGAPIYAVSLQNEFSYAATWDGCQYSPQENRDFWKTPGMPFEGRITQGVPGYGGGKELPSVLMMGGESHNELTPQDLALQDPHSRACIDIVGRHIYGNNRNPSPYPLATNPRFYTNPADPKFDAKEVWMTENDQHSEASGFENDPTWNYVWPFMNTVDLTIRLNNESAFIWWLIKRFYSMMGEGDYGTTNGVILPRGHGLSHYAKFAKETGRVGVDVTGTLANGAISTATVNQTSNVLNGTSVRVTAFVSVRDDFDWMRQKNNLTLNDITAINLVMYTPTLTASSDGLSMGTVKIKLPDGFVIRNAEAMRSTSTAQSRMETVPITKDRNAAYVTLPESTILSVRFTK
ncbi:glucuronoxylanase xynC [Treponema sp. R8-4-B8]